MKILAGLMMVCATIMQGAEPGSSVVLVYNGRMPESRKVAQHYADVRGVPASQVIGLDLPTTEAISRADFRKQLQEPLLDRLSSLKLLELSTKSRPKNPPANYSPVIRSSVRYLVLCYGVPLKITAEPGLKDPGAEKLQPELQQRNDAAVDSELALLPVAREKLMVTGPLPNPLYGQTNQLAFNPSNNVLMVTRLDGPTAEIALRLVDKAREAETNGLWGRAYFDARGITNAEYKVGDDWIRGGAQIARRLGFETVLDEAPATFPVGFPMSHIAIYAGWYDGAVSGPFTHPNVEFMPGAFAYHLYSYSAQTIRSPSSTWVGALLAKGATITMGAVEEPYISGTANIAVFLERLIWNRFTFGEAAYSASPVLSWQNTVIGDPLYQPFAEPPDRLHYRLESKTNQLVEWSHLRVLNLNLASGASSPDELFKYLAEIPWTEKSSVLQEKLGQLYLEKKQLSGTAKAYSKAVKLNPSPQQKIRLLVAIGELQMVLGQEKESYEAYSELLTTDYPNKPFILSRLITLGRTLGKTNEVQKFEAQLSPKPEQK